MVSLRCRKGDEVIEPHPFTKWYNKPLQKQKMMEAKNILFNPYIKPKTLYAGGKSKTEVASDKPIFKLSSNENMLGCSMAAIDAAKNALENIHEYPERTDLPLRQALQIFYKNKLSADHFITGNGASEIIEAIVRCFLGPNLEFIVSSPTFKPYEMFAAQVGAVAVDIPLKEDFKLDIVGILNAVNSQTRLLVLISPNNPTGTIITKIDIEQLLDRLPPHVVVLLDEVYWQYVQDTEYTTAIPFVLQDRPVIGINSFSKAYGMAGFRVGYAYTTLALAEYIRRLQKAFPLSSPSMAAACAALQDADFIKKTVGVIQNEKQKLYRAFDDLQLEYVPSEANFILVKPNMSELDFEHRLLQEGVMVRPAGPYGANGFVRITIGTEEANIALVQALRHILNT